MAVKKMSKFDQWPMGLNDEGNDVLTAQGMLVKAGSKIKENGVFSIGMVSAVKTFQKKNGLEVTGKIDQKTWDKLVANAKAKPAKRAPKVTVTLMTKAPAKGVKRK